MRLVPVQGVCEVGVCGVILNQLLQHPGDRGRGDPLSVSRGLSVNNSIHVNSPGMDSSIYPDSLLVAAASLAHPGYPDVAPLIGLAHSLTTQT